MLTMNCAWQLSAEVFLDFHWSKVNAMVQLQYRLQLTSPPLPLTSSKFFSQHDSSQRPSVHTTEPLYVQISDIIPTKVLGHMNDILLLVAEFLGMDILRPSAKTKTSSHEHSYYYNYKVSLSARQCVLCAGMFEGMPTCGPYARSELCVVLFG